MARRVEVFMTNVERRLVGARPSSATSTFGRGPRRSRLAPREITIAEWRRAVSLGQPS